jgi:putative colanic acid biosynthesis UDP-glucose lipid carrier transferase
MPNHRQSFVRYFRLLTDITFISTNYFLCNFIVFEKGFDKLNVLDFGVLFFILILWYFSSKKTELYDEFRISRFYAEIFRLANNVSIQVLFLIIITFVLNKSNDYRLFIIVFGISIFLILSIQKYLYRQFFIYLRYKGKNIRHLVVIGAGNVGRSFYEVIKNNIHFGYNVVGFVDDKVQNDLGKLYLGNIDYFLNNIDSFSFLDEIVIALPNSGNGKLEKIIAVANDNPVSLKVIPDYFPMITIREEPLDQLHNKLQKRLIDVFFSLFLFLTVFVWLFPLIALIIKLDSKGPVFFTQERWGKNNNPIKCYKFRSMKTNSDDLDENGIFKQASKSDKRITRVGRFLRKSNFDELPQFLNVLIGNMSVVGPRPHPTPLNIQSKSQIENYLLRHLVKPGITGWAQVNGFRGETSDINLMKKRIEYDIYYIENWSPILDLKIVFLTVWNMIKGEKNAY